MHLVIAASWCFWRHKDMIITWMTLIVGGWSMHKVCCFFRFHYSSRLQIFCNFYDQILRGFQDSLTEILYPDLKQLTVLAGMFKPIANVSVANRAFIKPSANNISMVSFSSGNKPEWCIPIPVKCLNDASNMYRTCMYILQTQIEVMTLVTKAGRELRCSVVKYQAAELQPQTAALHYLIFVYLVSALSFDGI